MENLYRLIYTSIRTESCDDQVLQELLETCQRNNVKQKITGILLHSHYRFLQYLEGDKETVLALYEHIKNDDRHYDCTLRTFKAIDWRLFPMWSMGYKDVDLQPYDVVLSDAKAEIIQDMLEGSPTSYTNFGMGILKSFFKAA